MTKENLLELLKASVSTLKNRGADLLTDDKLRKAWYKESEIINRETSKLSPDNIFWLNAEYHKWAEKNIMNNLKDILGDPEPDIDEENT